MNIDDTIGKALVASSVKEYLVFTVQLKEPVVKFSKYYFQTIAFQGGDQYYKASFPSLETALKDHLSLVNDLATQNIT